MNLADSLKDIEKENAVKVLGEKVMELLTEKEEMINTINNLNSIVNTIASKFQQREESLVQEIESLRKYAAEHSDEKYDDILKENKRLRDDLQTQKRKYNDMENQYRQENQDLMHLYIDAEETKKHILEQLSQIKQTKDRLLEDKRLVDATKSEILRVLDVQQTSQKPISQNRPDQPSPQYIKRPTADFGNNYESNQSEKDLQANYKPQTLDPMTSNNNLDNHIHPPEEDSNYADAINQRLQKMNVGGTDNPSGTISRDEETSISRIRQMIANLQNFESGDHS